MTQQRAETGYRGALPPRNDALARWWVIAVVVLFVLMVVGSFLGFPTRLFPEPSPSPSILPSFSFSAAPSASESPIESPGASPGQSPGSSGESPAGSPGQ